MRRMHVTCLAFVTATLWGSLAVRAGGVAEFDPRWAQGGRLEAEGRHPEALGLYHQLLEDYPNSQRVAMHLARCRETLGDEGRAIEAYQVAFDLAPYAYWAEPTLYYQARACARAGRVDEARASISLLRERFPDSPWLARAELVEAELDAASLGPEAAAAVMDDAADFLTTELCAGRLHDKVLSMYGEGVIPEQLSLLRQIIDSYPETSTALRAKQTKAHLQIRNGERTEAIATLEGLLAEAESSAPRSRIVEESKTRLAALYHAERRRPEALALYEELCETAGQPSVLSNAKLQAAGLRFELLQADRWNDIHEGRRERMEGLSGAPWDQLRSRCEEVLALPFSTADEKARAGIMIVESYHWQKRSADALVAAADFLQNHSKVEFPRQAAVAHLIAGECRQRMNSHAEAMAHFDAALAVLGDDTTWRYVPRIRFRMYHSLRRSGAPAEQVQAAANFVLDHYSDTVYADLIRTAQRWDSAAIVR